MCTRYPIINRVSELKVHIELTRFVQPENSKLMQTKGQLMKSLNTAFSFAPPSILSLTMLMSLLYHNDTIIKKEKELLRALLSQFCKLEFKVLFYFQNKLQSFYLQQFLQVSKPIK